MIYQGIIGCISESEGLDSSGLSSSAAVSPFSHIFTIHFMYPLFFYYEGGVCVTRIQNILINE